MNLSDIKQIIKRKMYQYAHCNLSKNNAYYVNDGMIKNAEAWFADYAVQKGLGQKTIKSIENHFKNLKATYLFN